MSQWKTEEQKRAAQSISSVFGGPTQQEQPVENNESLWDKVKTWLESQLNAKSPETQLEEAIQKKKK